MSKETSNPLVDLSDLSKPAVVLVEKISEGVGEIAAPWQIKRVAKAEAEAAIIKAQSEIKKTDLYRRAERRRIKEDMRDQKNIEDITAKAIPHLNEEAKPDAMEDDWVANFFDKCRTVSDNEMQRLWARVLASEANAPSTYSKRTVNFIAELDKSEAELFTKLCGFGWQIDDFIPLVFDEKAEIYNGHGINLDALSHLESIGLIQFQALGFMWSNFSQRFFADYYDKRLSLDLPKDTGNKLKIGKTRLTKIGQELAPICGSKPVAGFYEYVKIQWKQYLPKIENTGQKE